MSGKMRNARPGRTRQMGRSINLGFETMSHALIIDDNMLVSQVIENRLAPLGFDSFEHSWTEEQAVAAAERRLPDLVVVGDAVESGSALDAARRISAAHDVPVLMVTAKSPLTRRVAADAVVEGPYALDAIATAVKQAQRAA